MRPPEARAAALIRALGATAAFARDAHDPTALREQAAGFLEAIPTNPPALADKVTTKARVALGAQAADIVALLGTLIGEQPEVAWPVLPERGADTPRRDPMLAPSVRPEGGGPSVALRSRKSRRGRLRRRSPPAPVAPMRVAQAPRDAHLGRARSAARPDGARCGQGADAGADRACR